MCVCECIITHAQSIKGRLWLQMRLQSQADDDKRRKACFISQFHDFPQSEISWISESSLKDLDLLVFDRSEIW